MYAIEIYGNVPKSSIKSLQTLQNRAIRCLFGFPRLYPTKTMYAQLNIFKIDTLFSFRASLLLYRLMKQTDFLNVHTVLKSYCAPVAHKYPTRKKANFNLKYKRPSYTTSCSFKLFLLWNIISSEIKSAVSYCQFRKLLTKYYQYFLYSMKLPGLHFFLSLSVACI